MVPPTNLQQLSINGCLGDLTCTQASLEQPNVDMKISPPVKQCEQVSEASTMAEYWVRGQHAEQHVPAAPLYRCSSSERARCAMCSSSMFCVHTERTQASQTCTRTCGGVCLEQEGRARGEVKKGGDHVSGARLGHCLHPLACRMQAPQSQHSSHITL